MTTSQDLKTIGLKATAPRLKIGQPDLQGTWSNSTLTPMTRRPDVKDRLAKLGPYRFDVVLGESQTPTFHRWITAPEMAHHLSNLPHAANSGDVYAILGPDE